VGTGSAGILNWDWILSISSNSYEAEGLLLSSKVKQASSRGLNERGMFELNSDSNCSFKIFYLI
jgi:hypothetical protein